ncbi:MAG: hypothetical protein HYV47_02870 [Candidatus Nealsonbacteria bacterium]|nr:hypothetical protein [Candidatus Nealsonbacteria bacterium]
MITQLHPYQVKDLEKAYEDIEKLRKNTQGIKVATWVTAISTLTIAIAGIATLIIQTLK